MVKRGRKAKEKLFNTEPDNIEEILEVCQEYEKAKQARLGWLKKETDLKAKIKEMVKKAGLKPLEDGVIRFKADGYIISITPRDEVIKVKEEKDKD